MTQANSQYERIELYLLNKMSGSERTVFEKDLLVDKNLLEQFNDQKAEHELMDSIIAEDLNRSLHRWKSEAPVIDIAQEPEKKGIFSILRNPFSLGIPRLVGIAATVAVLFTTFYWLTSDTRNYSGEKMMAYAQSAYTPVNFGVYSDGSTRSDDPIEQSLTLFAQNDFENGIKKLNEAADNPDYSLIADYLLGMAHYSQREFNMAIVFFQKAKEKNEDFEHSESLDWYLALSYIQTENYAKAIKMLKNIKRNTKHKHYADALKILDDAKRE